MRGRRRHWPAWAFVVALVLAVPLPAPAQQSPSPPITAKPASLGGPGPFTITVENQTGAALTVTPTLQGVQADATLLPVPLSAGGRSTITVNLTAPPAEGAEAALVLTVGSVAPGLPAGWVTRIPISATAAKKAAEPTVKKWRTTSYGGLSWWTDTLRSETISLKNTGTCSDVDLTTGTRVGTLEAKGRSVAVSARCIQRKSGALAVRLSFNDLTLDGADYTGTIDLAPGEANKEIGDVELTLRRTTQGVNFLFWLVIGIGLGLLAAAWVATGRAVTDELLRVERLRWAIDPKNAKSAPGQFKTIVKKGDVTGTVPRWDITTAVSEELTQVKGTLRKIDRLLGGDAEGLKKAQERLTVVEAVIAAWPELANLLVRLHRARSGFDSLDRFKADVLNATLDRTDEKVSMADVVTIQAKAELGVNVAGWWPEDRVRATRQRYHELMAATRGSAAFKAARVEASAAWNEFDEQRKTALTVTQIEAVLGSLDVAASRITAALQLKLGARRDLISESDTSADAGAWVLHQDQPVDDPFTMTRKLKAQRWLADWAVFLVFLAAAIAAGAKALYVDKAVGGRWDYIEFVTWGLTATLVAGALATAVQRLAAGPPPDLPEA